MLMCRQVAKALAENRYYELPWYRRMPMFVHIRLCAMCGKYHRQVVTMQKGVREYLRHEDAGELHGDVVLSPDARARIEKAIRERTDGVTH